MKEKKRDKGERGNKSMAAQVSRLNLYFRINFEV